MSKYSLKKSKQLGMSFSTACSRLRLNILFNLVTEANKNLCFKCGDIIKSPEELSIEHKKDWLDVNPELFWDLNNIAFSHRKCNTKNILNRGRKCSSDDLVAWCSPCKLFLPIEKFSENRHRWNGLAGNCKDCAKKYR